MKSKQSRNRGIGLLLLLFLGMVRMAAAQEICLFAGGGNDGNIYKRSLAGGEWQNTAEFLPEGWITALQVHPETQSILAAAAQIPGSIHPRIYRSTDMGLHWTMMTELDGVDRITCFLESHDGDIWAGTAYYGAILHSVNAGITWEPVMLPDVSVIYDLMETPSGNLVAAGSTGQLYVTADGETWNTIDLPDITAVKALAKSPAGILYAGTDPAGTVFTSADEGLTWSSMTYPVPDSGHLLDMTTGDDGTLYVLIRSGAEDQPEVWTVTGPGGQWRFTAPVILTDPLTLLTGPDGRIYLAGGSPAQVLFWEPGFTNWESTGYAGTSDTIYSLVSGPCETSVEPTPTFTPRPTPTPRTESGAYSRMSDVYYSTGERFLYVAEAFRLPDKRAMPDPLHLYIALEVYGKFYFYPSWSQTVEYLVLDHLPPGMSSSFSVLDFSWPDVDGTALHLWLWTVLIDAATGDMYGRYDKSEFGYGNPEATPTPPPDPTATPVVPDMTITFINADAPLSWECGDERLYCFGETHFAKEYTVARIANTGGVAFPVNIGVAGDNPDLFQPMTGSDFTLAPGEIRDVNIRFDPSGVPGMKYAFMVISGAGETVQIDLQGHFIY